MRQTHQAGVLKNYFPAFSRFSSCFKCSFIVAPLAVVYDFGCAMEAFCMNMDPVFFANTKFLIDRLHINNHIGKYKKFQQRFHID